MDSLRLILITGSWRPRWGHHYRYQSPLLHTATRSHYIPSQISSETLANAVANEWMSQKKEINLTQMHINGNLSCIINKNSLHFPQGLCNTVIDNPGQVDKHKLVTSVLSFLETDTVLFYGEEPPELLKAQKEKWSPIILWFRERFGVSIEPTTNVMTPPVQECKRTSHF